MSAHALLNLLNELGKEIKCEACRAFSLFFPNSFNKLIKTRARMLDSKLSYDIMITWKFHFWW